MLHVDILTQMWQMPYIQKSFIALVFISLAASFLGVFINLKKLEFISDGLTHAVFPGMIFGFLFWGKGAIFLSALIFALITSILLTVIAHKNTGTDAATAIILSASFGLGIIMVSSDSAYFSQLERLLFGSVLTITEDQLLVLVTCSLVVFLGTLVFWQKQLMISFDSLSAKNSGVRVLFYDVVINVLISLIVVVASQVIGNLLLIAWLIVPIAMARTVTNKVYLLPMFAFFVLMISTIIGLYVSYYGAVSFDISLSPSSVIVIVLCFFYAIFLCIFLLRNKKKITIFVINNKDTK